MQQGPQNPPPADAAVVEAAAAEAKHPQTKAALHQLAANTYTQMAGGKPPTTPGAQIQQTQTAQDTPAPLHTKTNGAISNSPVGDVAMGAMLQPDPRVGIPTSPMQATPDQLYNPKALPYDAGVVGGLVGGGIKAGAEEAGNFIREGSSAVKNALEEAKAQPGGMQAGFAKFGPGEKPPVTQPVTKPLPPEPAGTSVQFNKDGTETIVPQDQRTNAPQYSQGEPQTPPESATPKFAGGDPALRQPAQNVPIEPPPRPAGDSLPVSNETSLPGGDPKQAPQAAVKQLDEAFTVPAKKAMNGIYKMDTYKGMVAHMQSGMDPGMLEQMPSLVSDSETGMVPKMIREVVGNVKGEIPLKDPGPAAESIIDNNRIFIDDKAKEAVLNDITRALPKSTNGSTVPAEDVLQYARALESKAAEIKQGDTYLTNRGDKRYLAQALNSAADDVMDQLGKYVTPEDLAAVKTPERMAYLQKLSPRLAAQVQNAQDVPKLRSSIRDFVRMGQIIEHTDASSGSVFGKLGGAMLSKTKSEQAANNAANIAHGLFHPRDAFTGITRGIVKGAVSPFDETPRGRMLKALQQPTTETQSARFAGKSGPNMGKGMKIAIGSGIIGGAGILGAEHLDQGSNAETNQVVNPNSQQPTDNSNNNHAPMIGQSGSNVNSLPATIDQLPGDQQGLKTFTPPWQMTGSDGKSLSMTPEQYKTQRNTLEQQYSQLAVNDPTSAAVVKGQIDQLDTTYKTGATIADAWTKASQVDAKIRDAMELSKSVSPQAIQSLPYIGGMAENIRASFDPKYHQLLQDLQYVQQNSPYGQGLTSIGDKETLTNTLQTVNKNMWGDYLIGVQHYSGVAPAGDGTVAPVSTTQEAPAATTTNQAGGALPASGSGFNIGGGTAPSLKFQSGQPAFAGQ